MFVSGHQKGPSPATMVVVVGVLIVLIMVMRGANSPTTDTLRSQFAAAEATTVMQQQTAVIPQPLRDLGSTAIARLQGGEAIAPITPVVNNSTLSVDIQSLQQVSGGLQIKGLVKNTSQRSIRVPLAAFRFIDQTGTVYASQGDAAANLNPGASTTLDLTLPIQNPITLTMLVEIPESDVHLELRLLTGQ